MNDKKPTLNDKTPTYRSSKSLEVGMLEKHSRWSFATGTCTLPSSFAPFVSMNECFLKNVACGQSRRDDGIVSGRASNTKVPPMRAPPTLQYSNKGVWNGSFLRCQSYLKPTWAHDDVERYKEGRRGETSIAFVRAQSKEARRRQAT